MISIIICSRHAEPNSSLKDNIKDSIGCDYEIIHIDNSNGMYNIFQAYNLGVSLSHGDILCFMHEDVLFHSSDWGLKVCEHLMNRQVGVIGVAGGYAVLSRSDWRMYGTSVVNLRQGYYCISEGSEYYSVPPVTMTENMVKVAVLDGVWFCMRKELFDNISFDDYLFSDFHLYDSDICMQINRLGLDVCVCGDIDLEHFSVGSYTEGYLHSLDKFLSKWKDVLPYQVGISLTPAQISQYEELGVAKLKARIVKDAILLNLRSKLSRKKAGDTNVMFSNEEVELMRRSAYHYVKNSIKDKSQSLKESYQIYRKLMRCGTLYSKSKLFLKLLYYKILRLFK